MMQKPLRIASYNIRKARGLDGKRAPARILAVINGLGADVVALQEADLRLGPRLSALPVRLIEAETDFQVADVARRPDSIGWHGNAVLVRKGISVTRTQAIDLPGFEPRGAVRVDIEGPEPMSVIGAHLGLMRRHRLVQLSVLRDAADRALPTVIAGDFNEWSADRGLEPLADDFEVLAPGRSFHARRPIAALDRMALSDRITMRDAGVDQSPLARKASDHLPIWADVAIEPVKVLRPSPHPAGFSAHL